MFDRDVPPYEGDKIEYDLTQNPLDITERLQKKWLLRMEYLIDGGLCTSTDLATLARVLMANGWTLDPAKLPQKLREKLTEAIGFDDDDDDGGVLPFRLRKEA